MGFGFFEENSPENSFYESLLHLGIYENMNSFVIFETRIYCNYTVSWLTRVDGNQFSCDVRNYRKKVAPCQTTFREVYNESIKLKRAKLS